MKDELYVILTSILLVFVFSFYLFDKSIYSSGTFEVEQKNKILGFIVFDSNLTNNTISPENISATKESALEVLDYINNTIVYMQSRNFTHTFFDDLLVKAQNAYSLAYYSSIMRGEENVSDIIVNEAKIYTRLTDWRLTNYSILNDIYISAQERRNTALLLSDYISLADKSLADYLDQGYDLNSSYIILAKARNSFGLEQYEDTATYLTQLQTDLESKREQRATFTTIKRGTQAFFIKNWKVLSIFLVILVIFGYALYKKIRKERIRRKIAKYKSEKEAIYQLIKKVQEQRFKSGEISSLIYNVRMQKYNEKLNTINEELPVLEDLLIDYK